MAPIIDEIGKKITAVGQGAKNAVQDFSQVSKLKDQITAERNRINACYLDIGQTYYKAHAGIPTDPFAQAMQQIQTSLDRIDILERDIKMIQKVKTCPTCGTSVKYDSAFCPKCGVAFRDYHALNEGETARFCTNCGAALMAEAIFCTECGAAAPVPFSAPTPPPAPMAWNKPEWTTPSAAAALDPDVPAKLFCTNCGTEPEPDSAFCVECGSPAPALEAISPAAESAEEVPVPVAEEEQSAEEAEEAPSAEISEPLAEEIAPAEAPREPLAEEVPFAAAFCLNCGAALEPEAAFCVECGMKI